MIKTLEALVSSLFVILLGILAVMTDYWKVLVDRGNDWTGAVIAFLILGLLSHLVAFILAVVNACRKVQPFPVFLVAVFFVIAAVCIIIALFVYTFKNWETDVFFSWSYGGGWSTVALSIIAFVLIMADR